MTISTANPLTASSKHHPPHLGYNNGMASPLSRKMTLNDLRRAREGGPPMAMLTCYDYTTAGLMQQAGVPLLLVGDSASNVLLGHPTTLPVTLAFMIEITAAVRRGAPLAFLLADMPFGSYHGSIDRGIKNIVRMLQRTGCDGVKLEVGETNLELVRTAADAGVAVVAHLGLRPQSVGVLGGYRVQGKNADDAMNVTRLATRMQDAGAAALLLEAVPTEVAQAVIGAVSIPVIGCGAGAACHAQVVVTHDILGLTAHRPRFAPQLGDLATPMLNVLNEYVTQVQNGQFPAAEHEYHLAPGEFEKFEQGQSRRSAAASKPSLGA
jgi:3-methyl-2-oxobutanoate hydroxymethyltransferase